MKAPFDKLAFLQEEDRHHLSVIAAELRRGNVALFCGAGLSFNARCRDGSDRRPAGWVDIARALATELPGIGEHDSPLKIADLYESTFGRAHLIGRLMDLIADGQFEPGDVHKLIPLMAFKEVVTTNFDTLLERAFDAQQVRPHVVLQDQDLVRQSWPRVIKLNGSFGRNPGAVVITGEDFRQYDERHPLLVSFLTNLFVESLVVFVGFSLEDPAFGKIYGRVRDILGREGRLAYSIQGKVPPGLVAFWAGRGVRILSLWSSRDGCTELDYEARLRLVVRSLFRDAGRDIFTRPVKDRATGEYHSAQAVRSAMSGDAVRTVREWLWQTGTSAGPAGAQGNEPGLPLQAAAGPPVGEDAGPSQRHPSASQKETIRKHLDAILGAHQPPRLALALFLPAPAWQSAAADLPVDIAGDVPPRCQFRLASGQTSDVHDAIARLRGQYPTSIEWQRLLLRILGALLQERFDPRCEPGGAIRIPWARQVMVALARELTGRSASHAHPTGTPSDPPCWLPDVPVVFAMVALLTWIEDTSEGQNLVHTARELLDFRCVGAENAERQREALWMLAMLGCAADVEIVERILEGRRDEQLEAKRLKEVAKRWVCNPRVARRTGDSRKCEPWENHGGVHRSIHDRMQDLAPDVRFRFATVVRARGNGELQKALESLRVLVFDDGRADLDAQRLGLLYRLLFLYDDYYHEAVDSLNIPFYQHVRSRVVGVTGVARAERRRAAAGDVKGQLHELMVLLGRGKALHVKPPSLIDQIWSTAALALARGHGKDVPWEWLIMLSLPAQGASFADLRDCVLGDVLEAGLLDVEFFLDLWTERVRDDAFAAFPKSDRDGRTLEDRSGAARMLQGLASFLRFLAGHVEWADSQNAPGLRKLLALAHVILIAHHDYPTVRSPLLHVIGKMSRVGPADDVRRVAEEWISHGAEQTSSGSLGLMEVDWERLLLHGSAREPVDPHLVRQLLGRALAPSHARTDFGRDVHAWMVELCRLDRLAGQEPNGSKRLLSDDARAVIVDNVSVALREESQIASLSWLDLAGRVRRAGIELGKSGEPGGPPAEGVDALYALVEDWFLRLDSKENLLRDWRLRQDRYLSDLEAFARPVPGAAEATPPMGAKLVEVLFGYFAEGAPGEPAAAEWTQARRDSVASLLAALRGARRAFQDGPAYWERCGPLLRELLTAGATGFGNTGDIADLLDDSLLAQLQARFWTALSRGSIASRVSAVEQAARCTELAAARDVPLMTLEERLVHLVATETRELRKASMEWLVQRLAAADAVEFANRHSGRLEGIRSVLMNENTRRPTLFAKCLLERIASALGARR